MLSPNTPYYKNSSYPGEYIPNQRKFEILEAELSKPHEGARNPAYNVCETPEYYKIEMAAPGLEREDFFVSITDQGHLSVSALHEEPNKIENKKYRKHTFNYECFNRVLLLPKNIDTDFGAAEYKEGILSFWFLKTDKPYQKRTVNIIVY